MNTETRDSQPGEVGRWTALIDDIVAGRWRNPVTRELEQVPYEQVVIQDSLAGAEADLVLDLGLPPPYAVVTDGKTLEALGQRVVEALRPRAEVASVSMKAPHADLATAAKLRDATKGARSLVAVGSGTINDLCKHVTAEDGRPYCVFATAATMNGYTSTTASMTLDSGLKVSLPAHAPTGFFVDLAVSAEAPAFLAAAGFGDCLCRSVAQIDWWMSHRLRGTHYDEVPYLIQAEDERKLNARAHRLPRRDIEATAYLYRVLTLCGLGVSFTGISNHGSMGEHQIAHYIDCFAGHRHPGTLHGQQVGVASLTMARVQQHFLASETPPVVQATRIDENDMRRRMGAEIAGQCLAEYRKKAFDEGSAAAFNARLEAEWPTLRKELLQFSIPVAEMEAMLAAAGGPACAKDLGLSVDFYREAVRHAHEMRNRFSFADIACDSGLLDDMAGAEV